MSSGVSYKMSSKSDNDEMFEICGSKLEQCSCFLTTKLGFAPARINRTVINHVARSLSTSDLNSEEVEAALIAAATVGETYFFRHRSHFDWVEQQWLPQWLERQGDRLLNRPLRVLSAGCASGEEAYTLAAVLWRKLADTDQSFEVTAFDVNEEFLDRAQNATYGLWSLRGVQIDRESDWLAIDGGTISVRPEVQRYVRFVEHNLLKSLDEVDELKGPFDLIVCRNVLIYFHDEAVQQAYANLGQVLDGQGALLVGPSDPGPSGSKELERQWEEGVRFYQKPSATPKSLAVPERLTPSQRSMKKTQDRSSRLTPAPPGGDPGFSSIDACAVARRLSRLSSTHLACDFLRCHLEDNPLDVEAHVLLALYCAETGDCEEAFQWGRRAVFLAPNEPYVIFVLSDICAQKGRAAGYRRYESWARELIQERPADEVLNYSNGCTVQQLREVLGGDGR